MPIQPSSRERFFDTIATAIRAIPLGIRQQREDEERQRQAELEEQFARTRIDQTQQQIDQTQQQIDQAGTRIGLQGRADARAQVAFDTQQKRQQKVLDLQDQQAGINRIGEAFAGRGVSRTQLRDANVILNRNVARASGAAGGASSAGRTTRAGQGSPNFLRFSSEREIEQAALAGEITSSEATQSFAILERDRNRTLQRGLLDKAIDKIADPTAFFSARISDFLKNSDNIQPSTEDMSDFIGEIENANEIGEGALFRSLELSPEQREAQARSRNFQIFRGLATHVGSDQAAEAFAIAQTKDPRNRVKLIDAINLGAKRQEREIAEGVQGAGSAPRIDRIDVSRGVVASDEEDGPQTFWATLSLAQQTFLKENVLRTFGVTRAETFEDRAPLGGFRRTATFDDRSVTAGGFTPIEESLGNFGIL